jgi:pyrrolysine biosynthesis protein PylD
MTRLYHKIIKDIPVSLPAQDQDLIKSTGHNLLSLAARATRMPYNAIVEEIKTYTAVVVPITSGEGVIPGFAESVSAILQHIGLKAQITEQPDVAGFGEALQSEADILFAADDLTFLAIHVRHKKVVDNSRATAEGFVQALSAAAEMRAKGLAGQKVLVLGLGPVGKYAVQALQKIEAEVWVFDTDETKLQKHLDTRGKVQVASNLETAFRTINYIIDATPAAEIIDETMIRPTTVISCPGVPHGLTAAARVKIGAAFIHDNLPLGVAVMVLQSIYPSPNTLCSSD